MITVIKTVTIRFPRSKVYQRSEETSVNLIISSFDLSNNIVSFEEMVTIGISKPHHDPLLIELLLKDLYVAA